MEAFTSKLGQKIFLALDSMQSGVTDSNCSKTGKLTASEFVESGDFLVANFPYWTWQKGLGESIRKHLPEDKQFLLMKHVRSVPSEDSSILETLLGEEGEEKKKKEEGRDHEEANDDDDDDEDGWVNATFEKPTKRIADGEEVELDDDGDDVPQGQKVMDDEDAYDDVDDIPSIEDDDDVEEMEVDPSAVIDEAELPTTTDNTVKSRTYDISITYDTHYSTPRVWLYGYDEENQPLLGDEWKEDFSKVHVDKTVTFEKHPHLGYSCATIHPCKHAEAMLSTLGLMGEGQDEPKDLDPKFYLFIFLKLVQSMIPNIDYDYMEVTN
eukprot:m.16291 g.16291  ORF g.16291 m.16291 type:complete len:324 (+) comp7982_c0_seq2:84-1055(+)